MFLADLPEEINRVVLAAAVAVHTDIAHAQSFPHLPE